MTPDPTRHVPTPGAETVGKHAGKVPKWAWPIAGGGAVLLLILVEHRRAKATATQAAATDATGATGGADASSVADPYASDPASISASGSDASGNSWDWASSGPGYALPPGSAPVEWGSPPNPSASTLPGAPTNINVTVTDTNPPASQPNTGGGLKNTPPGSTKRPKTNPRSIAKHHSEEKKHSGPLTQVH